MIPSIREVTPFDRIRFSDAAPQCPHTLSIPAPDTPSMNSDTRPQAVHSYS
jgi:hypothetical protein